MLLLHFFPGRLVELEKNADCAEKSPHDLMKTGDTVSKYECFRK